jgi:hypothetical protein
MKTLFCKQCGSVEVTEIINPEGHLHYSRINCNDCNAMVWGKKPSNDNNNTRSHNDKLKLLHKRRDGVYRCCWCGADERIFSDHLGWQFQLDHVIPISEGGLDSFENSQILCFVCHGDKRTEKASKVDL